MSFKYCIKNPEGKYAVEYGDMVNGMWQVFRIEWVDDRLKASHYRRRSEARHILQAYAEQQGVILSWEPV